MEHLKPGVDSCVVPGGVASGSGQTGLSDALSPGVQQLCHRVFVGQLQQFGRHVSVDRLQEAVGACWREESKH